MSGPANQGSIFRLADAFGVTQIIFCNSSINTNSSRLRKTSRSTHGWVSFRESEHPEIELEQLHTLGFTSVALEITSESNPIRQYTVTPHKDIVLIIGAENHGISESILELVHSVVHIPLYGANSSINVAQACAIALHELRR